MHLRVAVGAGPMLMSASAFLFAIMDCLIKYLGPTFRVWDIAFYRFGCGLGILILIFGLHHNPFRSGNPKMLIYRGVAGSMAFFSLVVALRMIPISTAMVLFYSYPAFAALFSAVLFKEKITRNVVWIVIALCGIGIFFDFHMEGNILGQVISVVGAAFSGLALATLKKARETNDSVVIYLYFCLAGTLMTAVPFASGPHFPGSPNEWVVVLGIIATSLVAQLLMNEGFRYCSSFEGGILMSSELIFVALWGLIFLGETTTWRFWAGGSMILASMFGLTRQTVHAANRHKISMLPDKNHAAKELHETPPGVTAR